MKLKSTLISLICVVVVGVVGGVLTMYWPAITGTVTNNQYLTPEQGQAMYDRGYADGNKNEENQLSQIDYYKNLADEYALQFNVMDSELTDLNSTVARNNQSIQNLTTKRNELQQQVTNLQNIKTENENTIHELNLQIISLQSQADQVPGLNAQISSLQNLVSQLRTINQLNADTITSLNAQIVELNNRIHNLSDISQNASAQIAILTNRCNELQASINYYESFISALENGEQVVATYEVDGSVWKIEIVNKGEITLPQFANTDTIVFNGWTVNDTLLGNIYTINTNTKFVASIVYKHTVQFMTDDVVYNTQSVIENEYATIPVAPTKTGYDFLGWSLNGVDIVNDIDTTVVTENVTYHAVFVKVHSVTFINGDQVIATQNVRNGEYANANAVTVETDGTFNGWQVNESIVNVNNYQILADTIFVAQISFDDVRLMSWNGLTNFDGRYVWTDNVNVFYSYGELQYVLDKSTHTWVAIEWNGLTSFNGINVWFDGANYYVSGIQKRDVASGKYYYTDYLLDTSNFVATELTFIDNNTAVYYFGIEIRYPGAVWSDGINLFYTYKPEVDSRVYETKHFIYDRTTHTFSVTEYCKPTFFVRSNVIGQCMIKIDNDIYCLRYNGGSQYSCKYDKSSDCWIGVNLAPTNVYLDGFNIFYDGFDYYILSGDYYYKLNRETMKFERISNWTGPKLYAAQFVWTDGVDYYYSSGSNQYVLKYRVA